MNSMNSLLMGGTIVLIAFITFLIFNKNKESSKNKDVQSLVKNECSALLPEKNRDLKELDISIETVTTKDIKEDSLFEISDSAIIASISQTFPSLAQFAAKTITNKGLNNVKFYKAIIPNGATLAKSREIEGASRAIYKEGQEIKGQANLVEVDPTKLNQTAQVANRVANTINVASIVVGQYYMAEINSKLQTMNNSINKINAFQERELKSKIIALLVRTKKISKFSSEIIENKELRRSQLFQLDRLEGEAVQLLEQVNLEIGELLENEDNTTFEKYKETTYELKKLIQSQQVIATTLEKISSLIYFFYQGEISLEISYSMFETYVEQSNKIRLKLNNWHERQIQNLGIELDTNKIVKSGLEGAVSYVPSFFNNQWRYKELPLELHDEIINQSQGSNLQIDKPEDVFDSDVQIIVKDGKYYYLHE